MLPSPVVYLLLGQMVYTVNEELHLCCSQAKIKQCMSEAEKSVGFYASDCSGREHEFCPWWYTGSRSVVSQTCRHPKDAMC